MLLVAILLFPVTLYYFSPALLLEGAAQGIVSGSGVVFAALFVSSLFLGRLFCGWLCPAGGLQELAFRINGRPVRRRRIRVVKFVIWAPWLAGFLVLLLQAGGIREVRFLWRTFHGISVADAQGAVTLLLIVLVFTGLGAAAGRRAGCHLLCWMAPFMILGRRARNLLAWPALKLAADRERCIRCGSCTGACRMSIPVHELVQAGDLETTDCILCGRCADACPASIIHYAFGSG
jgi:polyferredoxin